jgi:16S rRNA (guanine(1405)-N(7))-methyltransferase
MPESVDIAAFLEEVLQSAKYNRLSRGLVSKIAAEELNNQGNKTKAIKTTRTRLHRLAGAFIPTNINYAQWLDKLQDQPSFRAPEHLEKLKQVMRLHASTSERLPYLEFIYKDLFSLIPSPQSILDLACGLHPLAIPWMPITADIEYQACDIVLPMLNFLSTYFETFRPQTHIFECDILETQPNQTFDLIILLKTMPLLAQMDKTAPEKLLNTLNFRHMIVSYPLKSLGRQNKGMEKTYRAQFEALLEKKSFKVQEYAVANELFFILSHHD